MKSNALPRSSRVVSVTSIVSGIALIVGIGAAARKSANREMKQNGAAQIRRISPRVQNMTRSFELTQARQNLSNEAAGPELSLGNRYDKNITAFTVSVNGLMVSHDFIYSENEDQRAIAPGAVYTSWFSNVNRPASPGVAAREKLAKGQNLDINVLAVVFDDNSSDGDEEAVASIVHGRLKSRRILTRIVDLLDAHLNSLGDLSDTVFAELRSQIPSLSNDPGDSSDINDVLRWLEQSDNGLSPRKRIIRVKETCERLAARL